MANTQDEIFINQLSIYGMDCEEVLGLLVFGTLVGAVVFAIIVL